MRIFFDHETLSVYQQSLEFVKWSDAILDRTPKNSAMYAELDQGRTTLALKIAAGNARLPLPERARSLELAQRSALESAACLDLLFNKRILSRDEMQHGKEVLQKIVCALSQLTGSLQPNDDPQQIVAASGAN